MANQTLISSKLKLEYDGGVNSDGKQIIDSDTYSSLKTSASTEDIFSVSNKISGLKSKSLISIKRLDETEISN